MAERRQRPAEVHRVAVPGRRGRRRPAPGMPKLPGLPDPVAGSAGPGSVRRRAGRVMTSMETARSGRSRSTVAGVGCNNFDASRRRRIPRRGRSRARRGSTTSTPPTGTAAASRSGSSVTLGTHRDDVVITTKVGMRPRGRAAAAASTCSPRAASLAGSVPIGSISTSCTGRTPDTPVGEHSLHSASSSAGRCARSGVPTCRRAHSRSRVRGSSACRGFVNVQNDTTSCTGASRPKCFRGRAAGMTFTPFFPLASGVTPPASTPR
jgi:hypothetical protein